MAIEVVLPRLNSYLIFLLGAALGSITQTNDAGALKTIAVKYSGKFMIRDNKGKKEYLGMVKK